MPMNSEKIIIDCLDANRGVKKNSDEATIHRQLLDSFSKEIREAFIDNSKRVEDEYSPFIPEVNNHNYFITGVRGCGKSTFLRKLVSRLEEDGSNDLCFRRLCWYDPSESFGVNENFFISVVAALKSKFEEVSRQGGARISDYEYEVDCCRQTMKKLDTAIVRLSHNREELSELSEHKASMLRANNAETNHEIRQNFVRVVRLLCSLCKVKAFIVAIDDVDTRTKQCLHVLENLRLYISNANLIILMAGDKSMNIERVRESQFAEYNFNYHQADIDGQEVRMNAVVMHAGQYMAKLFPISHQRELRNLLTLSQKRKAIHVHLRIAADQKGNERTLREYVTEAFSCTISQEKSDIVSYVDHFMCLPLRSVMQVIDYWSHHHVWEKLEKLIERREIDTIRRHKKNLEMVIAEFKEYVKDVRYGKQPDVDESIRIINKVCIEIYRITMSGMKRFDSQKVIQNKVVRAIGDTHDKLCIYLRKNAAASDVKSRYMSILRAIAQLNKLRKFIIIQLPEKSEEDVKDMMTEVTYHVRVALNRTLIDQLHEEYYNFGSLNTNDANSFYAILLKHCQSIGDLDHGYFLSGDMGRSAEHKWITMLLALNFRNHTKGLRGFLSYMLYGPATVSLYAKALKQFQREQPELSSESIARFRKKFNEYLHVGSWCSPSRWARHANMIWCDNTRLSDIHSGVWRPDRDCMMKLNDYLLGRKARMSNIRISDSEMRVAMALIVSMNKSEEYDNSYYISVYSYLAFILQCIQTCDIHYVSDAARTDINELKNRMKRDLENVIVRYVPIKTCFRPDWQKDTEQEVNDVDINFETYLPMDSINIWSMIFVSDIAEDIVEWYIETQSLNPSYEDMSPRKMGVIWSNFYSSMRTFSHKAAREKNAEKVAIQTNEGKKSILEPYKDIIAYFVDKFCTPTSEELQSESRLYREALAKFPLTRCLKDITLA